MSFTDDFLRRKYFNSMIDAVERGKSSGLLSFYRKDNPDDYTLYNLFSNKDRILADFSNKYGWGKTLSGFAKRIDYKFDNETKEVVFYTIGVFKIDDKYVSDGSKLSNKFVEEHSEELETLANIEKEINKFYIHYNKELEPRRLRDQIAISEYTERIDHYAEGKKDHTWCYLNLYGDYGKNLLIKWLNMLNDTMMSDKDLLNEFLVDVEGADAYYNNVLADSYKRTFNFGFELLSELETYSIRGRHLRMLYNEHLRNEEEKEELERIKKH